MDAADVLELMAEFTLREQERVAREAAAKAEAEAEARRTRRGGGRRRG